MEISYEFHSQNITMDWSLWETLKAPAHSLWITSPSLCAHISQPLQRHSSKCSSLPAEQTVPRMKLSNSWKALHKLGLISSYTDSSARRHQLKEHIKGWIWFCFFKLLTINWCWKFQGNSHLFWDGKGKENTMQWLTEWSLQRCGKENLTKLRTMPAP